MSQPISNLISYGWDPNTYLEEPKLAEGLKPGRVLSVYGEYSKIIIEQGERKGIFSGVLAASGESVVTGDWVLVREIEGDELCIVEKILPRKLF